MTAEAGFAAGARSAFESATRHLHVAGLALLGFAIPISVAGVNIAKGLLLLVAVLLAPRIVRLGVWKHPAVVASYVLFGYVGIHTLAANGLSWPTLHAINRYQELLALPVYLALVLLCPRRGVFFFGLVVGATLVACKHWYALALHGTVDPMDPRRISAGFMLAVCAFVLIFESGAHARPWLLRGLALFLALTVLFAIGGRTGYVVLVVLATCLAWTQTPRRWRGVAAVGACAALVLLAATSREVQMRIHETLTTASIRSGSAADKATSTAIRMHMLRIAADIAQDHWLTGVGYAGYDAAHRAAASARKEHDPALYAQAPDIWMHTTNPHSEYLMHLLCGGVFGLLVFLGWLLAVFRSAAALDKAHGRMLRGLCIAFAVGCIFNSMMLDFAEGHFFITLLAWLLASAGGVPRRPAA